MDIEFARESSIQINADVFSMEAGAFAALILLGRYFEARSRGQASAAIEKLIDLGAKSARVVSGSAELNIPVEHVSALNSEHQPTA